MKFEEMTKEQKNHYRGLLRAAHLRAMYRRVLPDCEPKPRRGKGTLPHTDILAIYEAVTSGESIAEVAGRFGTSRRSVGRIARGESYAHITGAGHAQ